MGQVVLPAKAAQDVILVDGKCYVFSHASTEDPATHEMGDIDAQFGDCESCADFEMSSESSGDIQQLTNRGSEWITDRTGNRITWR
jgi:hypothetical protein